MALDGDVGDRIERLVEEMRSRISRVLAEAGQEAYSAAIEKVPVRTGRLRSSIRLEKVSDLAYVVVAGHPVKEKGRPYYAPFVEFGTRRMAPRPFMRPAADRAVQTIRSRL